MPKANQKTAFEFEVRHFFWNLLACLAGLHGQVAKKKYLDDDGTIFMAAISLVAKEIYPLAPTPPSFEECGRLCDACPPWLMPQTQMTCVEHGCHRYRETATSKLDADVRRNLCPLPGDIEYGVSYQTAFCLSTALQPPLFAEWFNGRVARIKERAFDHV